MAAALEGRNLHLKDGLKDERTSDAKMDSMAGQPATTNDVMKDWKVARAGNLVWNDRTEQILGC